MLRAQETKNIVAENLDCPQVVIDELRECSVFVYRGMCSLDSPTPPQQVEKSVHDFMERAVAGIQKALTYPGPVLIVAHGGVHWAFCHQLKVEHPSKDILHCVPVHFHFHNEKWKARLLKF